MIPRLLQAKLEDLSGQFPSLVLLGPRQSGKTTLAKATFPNHRYVNLESFDEREFASSDPKGFIKRFENGTGVIIDEIQKAPSILSEIQVTMDTVDRPGQFILTGSQNILLNHQVNQSLAGRAALTTLLPLSIEELRSSKKLPSNLSEAIFKGYYPRLHQNNIDPVVFAESYIRTYVERDVRDLKQISSLSDFQKFMRLCAGRIGQLLNLSSLANESGLSLATVKSWLSILEATYVIFLLRPHHKNFNKRLVKIPKLYFYDSSLACSLLGITKAEQVYSHYLKGGLFESMIISNLLKSRYHRTLPPNYYFWRDKVGNEVDCILEDEGELYPIEIKAAETLNSSLYEGLIKWREISHSSPENASLIYGGNENQSRKIGKAISWMNL